MALIKWTPKAEKDLEGVLKYIKKNFNKKIALETVYDLINYTQETLTKNPLAGSLVESNPLFAKLIYKGNVIYYCENPKDKNLYIVYVKPRRTDLIKARLSREEL